LEGKRLNIHHKKALKPPPSLRLSWIGGGLFAKAIRNIEPTAKVFSLSFSDFLAIKKNRG